MLAKDQANSALTAARLMMSLLRSEESVKQLGGDPAVREVAGVQDDQVSSSTDVLVSSVLAEEAETETQPVFLSDPTADIVDAESDSDQDIQVSQNDHKTRFKSVDISSPPPSLGKKAGRQEDDESDSCEDSSEDLPEGLDLQRYRGLQLCTLGAQHSCEDYWNTNTEEELGLLWRWGRQCKNQLQAGERRRPDIELDEDGDYPFSFLCSLLREVKNTRTLL